MLWILHVVTLVVCVSAVLENEKVTNHNVYLTIQHIQSEGYHAENHHPVTKDGYILEMHRIPYRRFENTSDNKRPVVFLMHGLLGASNSFTILGRKYSMAFHLADAGYDVWLGNARGTKNSRRHITLDPDVDSEKMKFFDFSFEEIGMYDVAAMVDYILNYTARDKLHYIGHSQGGTVFLVLNSLRPEYNEKFVSAHILAGVGYQDHFPNSQLFRLARFTDAIYSLALSLGFVELYPPIDTTETPVDANTSSTYFCTSYPYFQTICKTIGERLHLTSNEIDMDLIGGAALKQIAHYGQNVRDKAFRRWNYNTTINMKVYGSENPPKYNISLITVNTTMHYTMNDEILDEKDVLAMVNDMPHGTARRVERESFRHEEFATATDVKDLVTDHIIEAIALAQKVEDSDEIHDDIAIEEEEEDSPDPAPSISPRIMFNMYLIAFSLFINNL